MNRGKYTNYPYCGKEMKLVSIDEYDTLSWSPQGNQGKVLRSV